MSPLFAVLAAVVSSAPDAGAPDGAALFEKLQCVVCHSPERPLPTAPSLKDRFGSETTLRDGSRQRFDEAYIRESILAPTAKLAKGFQPLMPPFKGRLTDAELDALVAYVKSLSPEAAASTAPGEPVPTDR